MQAVFSNYAKARRLLLFAAIVAVVGLPAASRADDSEIKALIQRLEKLEKQNAVLQQKLEQQQSIKSQQQPSQLLQVKQEGPLFPSVAPQGSGSPNVGGAPAFGGGEGMGGSVGGSGMGGGFSGSAGGVSGPAGGGVSGSGAGTGDGAGSSISNPSPNPGGGNIAPGSFPSRRNERGGANYFAGWSEADGFFLRSPDNAFRLRLTGQVQADYRAYDIDNDATDVDSFLVRRARLGIEGTVFQHWEYRLLPEFSNGQSPTAFQATPRLLDAYVNAHYWDAFQVEAGKFKQPFSYEQLIQDRFIPTVERSILDQLVPARDEGVMVHGQNLLGDKLDYAFSVFNGERNADYDQNNAKGMAARLVLRPFNWEELPAYLQGLQLGMSYSWGRESETINGVTPNVVRTPDFVPFLTFTPGSREQGVRTQLSPEITYFYGPWGVAAQTYYGQQRFLPAAAAADTIPVQQTGYYVMSSLILTGETRTTYSETVIPRNKFDPEHFLANPGAWELIGRISSLRYSDNVFSTYAFTTKSGKKTTTTVYGPLANPANNSQEGSEFDIGFNWFLNRYIRVQLVYEHDWFLQPVQLGIGPNGRITHQDSLITRLQLQF